MIIIIIIIIIIIKTEIYIQPLTRKPEQERSKQTELAYRIAYKS